MCREGFSASLAVSFPGTQAQWPPARPAAQHPGSKDSPPPNAPGHSISSAQSRIDPIVIGSWKRVNI